MIRLLPCFLVSAVGALALSTAALPDDHEKGGDPAGIGPGLQRLVDLAVTDLATSLDVDKGTIEVVEAQYVTWRDSSAGCPKPDMQYLQVLTNGARIVLRANGKTYPYHSGGDRPPSYCSNPSPAKPLPYSHGET